MGKYKLTVTFTKSSSCSELEMTQLSNFIRREMEQFSGSIEVESISVKGGANAEEVLAGLATTISAEEAECIIPDSAKKRIAEYLEAEGREFLQKPYRGE